MTSLTLPSYAQLSDADEAALTELYRRGTSANTLRAWERDLAYISAWKMAHLWATAGLARKGAGRPAL